MREPKYLINDRVYHILPDSESGVVINISYLFAERMYKYQVAFCATEESLWYFEHELTTTKNY